jgi:signal peptidase
MDVLIKTIKFITNLISSIIIIVGTLFVILFAVGIQPFVVESGSMEPAIKTGSLCFINKKSPYEDIKKGDIIAFKIPSGAYVTHRVVEINNKGIITKGDANMNVDNVVTTQETYLGKNFFSIPKCGVIVKKIQTTPGKIIVATFILVLFIAGILLGEPSKKKKEETIKK